jgi:hypothetical protein
MTKLIVAFRKFANAPKNVYNVSVEICYKSCAVRGSQSKTEI